MARQVGGQAPRAAIAPTLRPQQGSWPIDREEVARVAYELFERRGRTDGRDQQDWLEAERIVRQQSQRRGNGH